MPTSIIFLKVQDFQIGAKNSNPSTSQVFFENWQLKLGELLSLELQKVIICRDLCYLWNPKLINYCSQFELTLAILYHWNVHKLCTLQVSPVFHLSLSLYILIKNCNGNLNSSIFRLFFCLLQSGSVKTVSVHFRNL